MAFHPLTLCVILLAQVGSPGVPPRLEGAARPGPGSGWDRGQTLADAEYRTACGPIAMLVSLRAIGLRSSLGEHTIAACGWREGAQTPFAKLAEALKDEPGVKARAVRLSPENLHEWLRHGNRAAILPVRKNQGGADHALCAVGTSGDLIKLVDYPELAFELSTRQLSDVWKGEAILVEERFPYEAAGVIALCGVVASASIWRGRPRLVRPSDTRRIIAC